MDSCPSPLEIIQFAGGRLDAASSRRMHAHIKSCAPCRQLYEASSETNSSRGLDATKSHVEAVGAMADSSSPQSIAARHLPQIEGFRIVGLLGKGGMGIVYRAVQMRLNRTVALKVLPAMVGAASPDAVERFRREATAAARLHHTNIIPIYDFGESQDTYYCAMELVDGKPLDEVVRRLSESRAVTATPAGLASIIEYILSGGETLESPSSGGSRSSASRASASSTGRGRLYFQQVARWIADAADALDYAHGAGIVHRDIKPGNLILSKDGRLMVADFGLARELDETSVTMTGSLLGTLRYMSPEQAMAKRVRVDHRTDIYSLGATLYELLTFEPAFAGDDDKEILGKIIARDPTPPRKVTPAVPREMETICLKTLEKHPDARYSTARELAEDLRRYINDLPIAAKRPGLPTRAFKFARRHRTLVVAGLAMAILGVSTAYFVRHSRAERRLATTQKVNALVEEGGRHLNSRNWQGAVSCNQRALEIDPTELRAGGNLAVAYKEWYNAEGHRDSHLLELAQQACDQTLQFHPDHTGLLSLYGVVLKMQGKLSDARRIHERIADTDPTNWANLSNLGMVHALLHDLDAAEIALRRAVDMFVSKEKPPVDPFRNLASIEHFRGQTSALERINRALERRPRDPMSLTIRARIRLDNPDAGVRRDALDDATAAVTISDTDAESPDPRTLRIRALAEWRNGRPADSARFAEWAIEQNDLPAINHLLLALAYASERRRDDAADHLGIAQATRPDELQSPGAYIVTAEEGILWFESADELDALANEVRKLLGDTPANP